MPAVLPSDVSGRTEKLQGAVTACLRHTAVFRMRLLSGGQKLSQWLFSPDSSEGFVTADVYIRSNCDGELGPLENSVWTPCERPLESSENQCIEVERRS